MKKIALSLAMAALAASPLAAEVQGEEPVVKTLPATPAPSPNAIIAQAAPSEWIAIPASDLLVMDLAPDRDGNARRVIIQLMSAPFSQGWVRNIRKLAAAKWWDGTSINRVQDNYVVQWGDADYDNPESKGAAKSLPADLEVVPESGYQAVLPEDINGMINYQTKDSYAKFVGHYEGWQYGSDMDQYWPTHCYGMVGVGRNLSPDTGTGAELYTVIGHAPRHLDRNIALVGRIIEGMEHLSSLPRGKGELGFYEDPAKRVPILSVRMGNDVSSPPSSSEALGQKKTLPPSSSEALGQKETLKFEYLTTEGETFARYAEARANRRDPFFNVPAGGADICNIPVPVRRAGE